MKKLLLIVLFTSIKTFVNAQSYNTPIWGKQQVINGYHQRISGEILPYISMHSDIINHSLLTRCNKGKMKIEWQTDTVNFSENQKFVYIVWVFAHSTGTNSGTRFFDFFVNDDFKIKIKTLQKNYPPYQAFNSSNDSTALLYDYKKKDIFGDLHGYAILKIETKNLKNHAPVKLKLIGENQQSEDWMMAYQFEYKNQIRIKPFPFEFQNNHEQVLNFKIFDVDDNKKITIKIDDRIIEKSFTTNYNDFNISIPKVLSTKHLHIVVNNTTTKLLDTILKIEPVVYREIYLLPHSHNDIGYSHLQEQVEQIQNQNIILALRQIKLTEKSKAPFKWNVESAWAVENFLKIATPQQRQDFFEAVKKNQIGLSAFYANELTGLMTQDELNWTVDYAAKLRTDFQLPIKSAMQSDIPGMSWGTVSALAKHGIRYVSHAPNYMEQFPAHGDRIGNTLIEQADKMFWWKSVSGNDSVLFWTCGKGYSSFHGFKAGDINERGQEKIGNYMDELQRNKYPYSIVQWRYNIGSDNGPVDSSLSAFVEKWNEMYASPKIKIATTNEVFEDFEKKYGKQIPVQSGDFTGYWEDGAYSSATEEGDARILSLKISALEKYAKQHQIKLDEQLLYRAKRSIVMWHEHTWGAWCSISAPNDTFTIKQWNYKKRFVDSAQYYFNILTKNINSKSNNSSVYKWEMMGQIPSKDIFFIDGMNPDSIVDVNSSNAKKFMDSLQLKVKIDTVENIFHYQISFVKKSNLDKEAMHIGFKNSFKHPTYRISIDSSFYTPCQQQINGANKDYFAAQTWIDVSNDTTGVTYFCPQANLYELDKIDNEMRSDYGKVWTNDCPKTSTCFLYALNNYWHTNYKASQSGQILFDIYTQEHQAFDLKKAQQFVQKIIDEEICK